MNYFRLQPPDNLMSRLFALEYLREIGAEEVYEKSNEEQKKQFFYKFYGDIEDITEVDFNWERLLFKATLSQIGYLLEPFIDKCKEIDSKRLANIKKVHEISIPKDNIADFNLKTFIDADLRNRASSKGILTKDGVINLDNKDNNNQSGLII